MLEARPTYRLLQTYSLLAMILREVPVARLAGGGNGSSGWSGGSGGRAGEALLSTVLPGALGKKELTKAVLSGNALLQV